MGRKIYCDSCRKPIKDREDLVTAAYPVSIRPFHSECYAQDLKGAKSLFLNNTPVNGLSGNFGAVMLAVICVIGATFLEGVERILALMGILTAGAVRLYSYMKYERYLT